MPTDINGYNSSFQNFVDFAQRRVDVADESSIARVTSTTVTLDGDQTHTIKAASTDKLGFFAAIFRSSADRADNDAARAAFRQAVADMFGGESKIPPSVKDAMKLGDFGHGRPLTARRILAVRNAIDATGVLRKALATRDPGFTNPATAARATQLGYTRAELPSVARAIRYCQQAMNCTEAVAANEVLTPGTKANRLLNYGGRFLASAGNFEKGLRLLDSFASWYTGLKSMNGLHGAARLAQATTGGKLNLSKFNVSHTLISPDASLGFERMVFDDIAHDPDFDLNETDPEQAFGFEHNATSRFVGRNFCPYDLGTINALPPSKRRVVYAVYDLIMPPLAKTAAEAARPSKILYESVVFSRIAKNIDRLAILLDRGQLTLENALDLCLPEMPANFPRNVKGINDTLRIFDDAFLKQGSNESITRKLIRDMYSSGASLKDVLNAHREGRVLQPYRYYSPLGITLRENTGYPAPARAQLFNDLDPSRIGAYKDARGNAVLQPDDNAYDFNFPDGQRIKAGKTTDPNAPATIADKVETLCGRAHPRQANAVMYALTQNSLFHLCNNPLKAYGISTTEHSPVKFTLSRNNETGAITIRFSNPDALPAKFSWETTIAIDGSSTSTSMVVEPPPGH